MALFEGKSPAERNKTIAAFVLGGLALFALFMAFGPSFGGSSTSVSVTVTPTPRAGTTPRREIGPVEMPSQAEQDLGYMIPVFYDQRFFSAPDPGRNIFAFYEPPRPCPECPTPIPVSTPIPTPSPSPPLPFELTGLAPQSVYQGSKAFRIEVAGDRFTPDAKIYFNNMELPTTFLGPQRLAANVPADTIANQGNPQVMVRTPDGKGYSLPTFFTIQAPPRPQFKYIGMIARRLGNNDTAYFEEQGRQMPTPYRLNDVVSGRFRLVNISSEKVVLEDVNLGFRHSVELSRPAPGTASSQPTGPGGRPFPGGFPQNPGTSQGIPGIPDGIPRYTPPNRPPNANAQPPPKRDVDDEDDDDDPDKP